MSYNPNARMATPEENLDLLVALHQLVEQYQRKPNNETWQHIQALEAEAKSRGLTDEALAVWG